MVTCRKYKQNRKLKKKLRQGRRATLSTSRAIKKVKNSAVVFSVYGNDLRYFKLLKPNIKKARTYYPGWKIVIMAGETAFYDELKSLEETGDIDLYHDANKFTRSASRFFAVDNTKYDRLIFRDADSIIGKREMVAVGEWIISGRILHGMKDHVAHKRPLLAGMWGADSRRLRKLIYMREKVTIEELYMHYIGLREDKEPYGVDEDFLDFLLSKVGWKNLLSHENPLVAHNKEWIPFPIVRRGSDYIGKVIF